MALETGKWFSDLVATNPPGGDNISEADDHLRLIKTVLKNHFPNMATSSGTNAIVVTFSPAWTEYKEGVTVVFKAGGANTGVATFNANGLGAIAIQGGGIDLRNGAIVVDDIVVGVIRDVSGTKTLQVLTNKHPVFWNIDLSGSDGPTGTADVGYRGSPLTEPSANYTLVRNDAGRTIYHISGAAHTYTIPANASVSFPIGTIILIKNESGGGNVTISITSDTLRWAALTGSRTLSANGNAAIQKMTATMWRLTGDGIT